jgi:hypothetical protein
MLPAKSTAAGGAVNGGELLMLALATCKVERLAWQANRVAPDDR